MTCRTIKGLFFFDKVFGLMRRMVKGNSSSPFDRPVGKLGMVGRKTFILFFVTRLTCTVAHPSKIVLGTMMFSMTGRTSQGLMGIDPAATGRIRRTIH